MKVLSGLRFLNCRASVRPLIRASGAGFVALAATVVSTPLSAAPLIGGGEIPKYLVIATGEGSSGNEFAAFQMSNVEIGADQEVVSNSSVGAPSQDTDSFVSAPDLTGDFVPTNGANAAFGGNRWNDVDPDHPGDEVGIPDILPGARPLFEGIDFSGNVAITGDNANMVAFSKFTSSNVDVYADIGIQCNTSPAACFPNPSSSNTYYPDAQSVMDDAGQNLNNLFGISLFDPTTLVDQLELARDFIVGLAADTTFTSGFTNQNIKDSMAGPVVTDLDAIDAAGNADGFAVIDIDVGNNAFQVNTTDWILNSSMGTIAIIRMKQGTQFDFANSAIMLGDKTDNSTDVIQDLGAIFFMDAYKGTNEVFNNNNVILGGVALWDFTDFNPDRTALLNPAASAFAPAISGASEQADRTVVNLQNAQGCSQFISNQVLMSNNRWNRCAQGAMTAVPEPATLLPFSIGLIWLGLFVWRRKSPQCAAV